jgi:hypothetical protein
MTLGVEGHDVSLHTGSSYHARHCFPHCRKARVTFHYHLHDYFPDSLRSNSDSYYPQLKQPLGRFTTTVESRDVTDGPMA